MTKRAMIVTTNGNSAEYTRAYHSLVPISLTAFTVIKTIEETKPQKMGVAMRAWRPGAGVRCCVYSLDSSTGAGVVLVYVK